MVVDLVRHEGNVRMGGKARHQLVDLRLGVTPPVGLAGELMMSRRVRGVMSASVSSAEKAKPFSSRIGTGMGVAPVCSIMER